MKNAITPTELRALRVAAQYGIVTSVGNGRAERIPGATISNLCARGLLEGGVDVDERTGRSGFSMKPGVKTTKMVVAWGKITEAGRAALAEVVS
jgi:hypothetical protein